MSNKSILERLLVEIDIYDSSREGSDDFAERFQNTIEALEAVPYSVIKESRNWQFKIEMEGYFDEEGFESQLEVIIPQLKNWVHELIEKYS